MILLKVCGTTELEIHIDNQTVHKNEDYFEVLLTKETMIESKRITFDQNLLRCKLLVNIHELLVSTRFKV